MSRLLWNDRGTPDRKKGRDTMGFTGSFAPVTTLFAVQSIWTAAAYIFLPRRTRRSVRWQ